VVDFFGFPASPFFFLGNSNAFFIRSSLGLDKSLHRHKSSINFDAMSSTHMSDKRFE
jgi:hypothetical protein